MKGAYLGELEELILLSVAVLYDHAYGVTIVEEMDQRISRKISIGAVYTVLMRLEEKGYVCSHEGAATQRRGGRRKKLYRLTNSGEEALRFAQDIRQRFWSAIPQAAFPSHSL
ncbi:MAG: PadR family transcriptional regulator [Cyclobacteriaceae bacterium]